MNSVLLLPDVFEIRIQLPSTATTVLSPVNAERSADELYYDALREAKRSRIKYNMWKHLNISATCTTGMDGTPRPYKGITPWVDLPLWRWSIFVISFNKDQNLDIAHQHDDIKTFQGCQYQFPGTLASPIWQILWQMEASTGANDGSLDLRKHLPDTCSQDCGLHRWSTETWSS